MSYFKRFTNFCAGFTAFHAIIYLVGQFMSFNPAGNPSMLEKLKLFLANDHPKSHREYIALIFLLIFSAVVGRIFERMPYISMAVSILPLIKIIIMFCDGKLFDRPMLYVLLGLLHTSGNIAYAISLDKYDGKRRANLCAHIFGASAFAMALWLKLRADKLAELEEAARAGLGDLDLSILAGAENGLDSLLFKLGLFVLISVAVSIILRDVYFVDTILALFPFGFCVYLITAGKLTLFPAIVLAVTFLYFAFRLLVFVAEPMAGELSLPWKRKKETE